MHARMTHPAVLLPDAMRAMQSLSESTHGHGVPDATLEMVRLRCSQINGCGFCVDMHSRGLKEMGESDERVWGVAAWRESPHFSEPERAALELAEAATRVADRPDPVSDELWARLGKHYDEEALAALLFAIGEINVWNRLNASIRQPAGPRG